MDKNFKNYLNQILDFSDLNEEQMMFMMNQLFL